MSRSLPLLCPRFGFIFLKTGSGSFRFVMFIFVCIIFIMVIFCAVTGKIFPPELGLFSHDGIGSCSGVCGVFWCLFDLLTAVVIDAFLCAFCGMCALRLCALLHLPFDLADRSRFLQMLPYFFIVHVFPPRKTRGRFSPAPCVVSGCYIQICSSGLVDMSSYSFVSFGNRFANGTSALP